MFSGLSKFLKIILPKGLFYRSLIIVAAPIIILQLIITIVFFDSIWIKANKGMTRSLVGEIKTLVDINNSLNKNQIQLLKNSYKENFDFKINVLKNHYLNKISRESLAQWIGRSERIKISFWKRELLVRHNKLSRNC